MNRETSTAREVAELLTDDLGPEVEESCFDFLNLRAEELEVFEGKTIRWLSEAEQDPFDFSDPWTHDLRTGCYVKAPVEGLAYAYIVASVGWYGGGRVATLWKGKLLDPSEAE